MSLLDIAWQSAGGVVGVSLGIQFVRVLLRHRALDQSWNWSSEAERERYLYFWGWGLALALFGSVFFFGYEGSLPGFLIGVIVGYLLRRVWRIDDTPLASETEKYSGD